MTIEDLLFANGKKFDLGHAPEATTLSKETEEKRAWSPFSVSLSSESGADSGMTPVGQPPVWPSAKRVVGSEVGRTAWPIPRKVASTGERPKWRF
ncbi:hypothetical protein DPMN_079563 [Dreissena polymorpha]|uniref:Uncharacterized protein n=1 Tax=Dreissena polymorpha TaxID=45954 RepID=A0A9D4BT33_DREPO|nr:hypothetical protein DPMN_079563 [Dreissena polymorpha]